MHAHVSKVFAQAPNATLMLDTAVEHLGDTWIKLHDGTRLTANAIIDARGATRQ